MSEIERLIEDAYEFTCSHCGHRGVLGTDVVLDTDNDLIYCSSLSACESRAGSPAPRPWEEKT